MSKKENTNSEAGQNKVREPKAVYKTIQIFDSFEEENEYTWRSYAQLTPEERLASVTRMRLTAHPYLNENSKPWGRKIYIDSK